MGITQAAITSTITVLNKLVGKLAIVPRSDHLVMGACDCGAGRILACVVWQKAAAAVVICGAAGGSAELLALWVHCGVGHRVRVIGSASHGHWQCVQGTQGMAHQLCAFVVVLAVASLRITCLM